MTKLIHANMLKLYLQHVADSEDVERLVETTGGSPYKVVATSLVEEEIEDPGVEEDGWLNLCPTKASQDYRDVLINSDLLSLQKEQVTNLLKEYRCIFSDLPGNTNLIEHKILLSIEEPIRKKPYPISSI